MTNEQILMCANCMPDSTVKTELIALVKRLRFKNYQLHGYSHVGIEVVSEFQPHHFEEIYRQWPILQRLLYMYTVDHKFFKAEIEDIHEQGFSFQLYSGAGTLKYVYSYIDRACMIYIMHRNGLGLTRVDVSGKLQSRFYHAD